MANNFLFINNKYFTTNFTLTNYNCKGVWKINLTKYFCQLPYTAS